MGAMSPTRPLAALHQALPILNAVDWTDVALNHPDMAQLAELVMLATEAITTELRDQTMPEPDPEYAELLAALGDFHRDLASAHLDLTVRLYDLAGHAPPGETDPDPEPVPVEPAPVTPAPIDPDPDLPSQTSPEVGDVLTSGPFVPPGDETPKAIRSDSHRRYFTGGAMATTPVWPEPGAPSTVMLYSDNTGRAWIERLHQVEGADSEHATTAQDQHIQFAGVPDVQHTHEFRLIDTPKYPWDWGKTAKIGGVVAFDGDWENWPGGHRSTDAPQRNASVRTVLTRWFPGDTLPEDPPEARLAVYAYLASADVDPGSRRPGYTADRAGRGKIAQWTIDSLGEPPTNRWIQVCYRLWMNTPGKHDGRMSVYLRVANADGVYRTELANVLYVKGLQFVEEEGTGWNRTYFCPMFGGATPDYGPHNDNREAWIGIGQHDTQSIIDPIEG